ncbi:MAG: DNA polymerase III subunit delta' [Methylophaga sp.]|nr:MAG: DNA polymerase III subunit delta' [Methylophaga sp.]
MYIWQRPLWQQFIEQKQQQRLPHAILLSGVKGLGKAEFVEYLVASVLCQSTKDNGDACGTCHSCQLLSAGSHPDHIDITPEQAGKQIKIEQIRALKDKQQLTANVSAWKTVTISPADSMTTSASNSLLKLLEEPQQNTVLILITAKPESLPITIKSRCQSFHMATPDNEQAKQWIKANTQNIADKDLDKLLQLAKGAPLAAATLLNEQGSEQYQQIEQDFQQLLLGDVNPVTLAASWQQYDLTEVMNQLQLLVKNMIVSQLSNKGDVDSKYWAISDCIIGTLKLISSQHNINKILLIEDFMVSVMQLDNRANT